MLVQGDARHLPLRDGCVQTVVTSPPYWGLRDYGTGKWSGGDPACDHKHETQHQKQGAPSQRKGRSNVEAQRNENFRDVCGKCGAQRLDAQLGAEKTPEAYVQDLVEVFREVRRVLREDGTVWLNLGDSYANDGKWGGSTGGKHAAGLHGQTGIGRQKVNTGLKPKDLVGIPWRVAFALRADGWYLRSDIIWAKPNPMPESVTDRPTRSHEYVFLLTKSAKYYYDHEGSKEPASNTPGGRLTRAKRRALGESVEDAARKAQQGHAGEGRGLEGFGVPTTRNRRSVWTITTKPYAGAHFATFPPDLVEPCILAGTPEGGCCAECGSPFRRLIEKGPPNHAHQQACGADAAGGYNGTAQKAYAAALAQDPSATKARILAGMVERRTLGWQPQCRCGATAVPSLVLDPFVGSGTVVAVAERLGRRGVGVDLKGEYLGLAQARLAGGRRAPMLDKQAGHVRRHAGFNARYFGRPPAEVAASPAVSTRPSFLRRFR